MNTSRLIEELARVGREHLLAEQWLLAPSLRVGHQWLDSVTRTGQSIVNVHVKTVKSMALDLAAPDMSARHLRLLTGRAGPMLVDRAFRQLHRQGLEYLGALRASSGLAEVIHRSIQSIRVSGIALDKVPDDRFEVVGKGRDIRRILAAYLESLAQSGVVDYADVLRFAIQRLKGKADVLRPGQWVLIPEDLRLIGLERELLQALPGTQRTVLAVDTPVSETEPPDPALNDLALLRWLPCGSDTPPPVEDGSVEFFHAVGEVNEVREVFRRLAGSGIRLDEVELLHTDVETYVSLVYETLASTLCEEALCDEDLPVTFADGIPVRFFRPGRLLGAWAKWICEDFPQSRLVGMVREGLLTSPELREQQFNFSRLAAVLRSIGIGFGRDRYLPKLDEEIASLTRCLAKLPEDADDGQDDRRQGYARRLDEMRMLRHLVASVLEVSPAPDSSQKTVLDAAIRMLDTVARTTSKSDNFARQRLTEDIADLKNWVLGDRDPAALDVWPWLSRLPQEARVLGSGPRPGCLHVASLLAGGHSSRQHTFIVGLDDSRFPGVGSQDPLLLDGERAKISQALPTAAARLEERVRDFLRLLARLRGKLTLGFSSRDLSDDREKFPSALLLSAYRAVSGNQAGSQEDFFQWLGRPVSFAPSDETSCLDMKEWWLRQLCASEPIRNARQLVLRSFPHLARGDMALARRTSNEFTAYDGRVERAGLDLDPSQTQGPVMSSGRLETMGQCPLRFFFRYGLQIEPPEELELDPTRWLDPITAGAMLHEVFEHFIRELADDDEPPRYPDHLVRLEKVLQSRIRVYRDLYPPLSEQVYQAQLAEFARVIRTFLVEEDRYFRETGNQPVYLEASLGMRSDGEGSAMDTDQPIPMQLSDGNTLRVRGRVDRIDRVCCEGVPSFIIWDYKTGSAWKYDQADPFKQGRVVQPAVYTSMVAHRLRRAIKGTTEVAQFGFFFPGRRERGRRIQWAPDELSDGPRVLSHLVGIIRNGAFLATDQQNDCSYCEYASICGDLDAVTAASAKKLANSSNKTLKPMKELRSDGSK